MLQVRYTSMHLVDNVKDGIHLKPSIKILELSLFTATSIGTHPEPQVMPFYMKLERLHAL